MEAEKQITEVADKFEEVQIEEVRIDDGEGSDFQNDVKIDEKLKRNSLSKFFSFKANSSSEVDVKDEKITKAKALFSLFQQKKISASEDVESNNPAKEKGSKTSSLTRLFSKKEKNENGAESSTRSLMTIVPWLGRRQSHVNLQKPHAVAVIDSDDSVQQEITTNSQIFIDPGL